MGKEVGAGGRFDIFLDSAVVIKNSSFEKLFIHVSTASFKY